MKRKVVTRKMKIEQSKTVKKPRAKAGDSAQVDVFISPESSNVEGGSYYGDVKTAVIAFRDKKNPLAPTIYYAYANMDPADWQGLKEAPSKGKFMAEVIKKKYTGTQVQG